MKKSMMLVLSAAVLAGCISPAHAISAHYRAQLERSGCTQISAGDGSCDISKTKAENAAQHEPTASVHDPLREASFSSDTVKEGANKQVISSQADSLIKISRIWADFFPANTSNQPI